LDERPVKELLDADQYVLRILFDDLHVVGPYRKKMRQRVPNGTNLVQFVFDNVLAP
jgi:hypothetical protein